jgi:hypothetical protein
MAPGKGLLDEVSSPVLPSDPKRAPKKARIEISRQWARVVVELGGIAHE